MKTKMFLKLRFKSPEYVAWFSRKQANSPDSNSVCWVNDAATLYVLKTFQLSLPVNVLF